MYTFLSFLDKAAWSLLFLPRSLFLSLSPTILSNSFETRINATVTPDVQTTNSAAGEGRPVCWITDSTLRAHALKGGTVYSALYPTALRQQSVTLIVKLSMHKPSYCGIGRAFGRAAGALAAPLITPLSSTPLSRHAGLRGRGGS